MTVHSVRDEPERLGLVLGDVVRTMRRRKDLSQRQLARYAEVAPATLARIESGETPDPRFRVVERIVSTLGGWLWVLDDEGAPVEPYVDSGIRDRAGRRYPPHLDVRPVPEDLTGWWRKEWCLTSFYPPYDVPFWTYDLDRADRDDLRRRLGATFRDGLGYDRR